jgi:mxaK protein
MINKLYIAHWGLIAVAVASSAAAGYAAWTLSETNNVNSYIADPSRSEEVPTHEKAQFSKAFYDAKQGNGEQALVRLIETVSSDDDKLEAAIYFNRANINLREAIALPSENTGRMALVGLAKQDYRNALLVDPSLWDARYNLEYSLLMAPEEPDVISKNGREKGHATVIVKVVGFRVDLP